MKRLSVRLVISHVLVAVIGAAVAFGVVRWLAPALFDESLRRGPSMGNGRGPGAGQAGQGWAGALRDQFAAAVDQALLIGSGAGVVAAAVFGIYAARRLVRSVNVVRTGTAELAAGRYGVPVSEPSEPELAELAQDVNRLGERLAQTEATRMRLLGEVAHELRTPLTVIDGYVEAMTDGILPASAENLTQISDETRRLRRLGEDLSSLSRAEEGRLSTTLTSSEVGLVVTQAAERLRPQANDLGVRLVVNTEASLPGRIDPDRIAQVVTNLVGNALRATPSGGSITVSARSYRNRILVSVADTGIGLTPDQLAKVFERFYRTTHQRSGESGSGIGLTISRGIARAHGGELTASSPGLGQGATFTMSLPLTG